MNTYAILLRGINVGGKNKISMAELKISLEEQGFKNVKTYINSGNVLVSSDLSVTIIQDTIEELIPVKFKLDSSIIKVLVLSRKTLCEVIEQAPKGFGSEPAKFHSDVIFLMDISPEDALKVFSPKEGIDRIWPGNSVIYSQRLSALRVKSRLNKIVGTPSYKNMTIRNWNTTTKLWQLMNEIEADKRA